MAAATSSFRRCRPWSQAPGGSDPKQLMWKSIQPHQYWTLILILLLLQQPSRGGSVRTPVGSVLLPSTGSQIAFFQPKLESPGSIDLSQLVLRPYGASEADFSIDVVEFHVENDCHNVEEGCGEVWSFTAGVGVVERGNDGVDFHWCCTEEVLAKGLCHSSQLHRLIVDPNKLASGSIDHQEVILRKDALSVQDDFYLHEAKLFRAAGQYVVLLAHCNERGPPVEVAGTWGVSSEGQNKHEADSSNKPSLPSSLHLSEEGLDVTLEPSPVAVKFFQHTLYTSGTFDMSHIRFQTNATTGTEDALVEVVEFKLPNPCPRDSWETCAVQWYASKGIGALRSDTGTDKPASVQFCCTAEAVQQSLCRASQEGQLIFDITNTTDSVFYRKISIPSQGDLVAYLHNAKYLFRLQGVYAVVMANCSPKGRPIHVTGSWGFLSGASAGVLPPNAEGSASQQQQPTASTPPATHVMPTRPLPMGTTPTGSPTSQDILNPTIQGSLHSTSSSTTSPTSSQLEDGDGEHVPKFEPSDIVLEEEAVLLSPLFWPALVILIAALLVVVALHRMGNCLKLRGQNEKIFRSIGVELRQDTEIDFCFSEDSSSDVFPEPIELSDGESPIMDLGDSTLDYGDAVDPPSPTTARTLPPIA